MALKTTPTSDTNRVYVDYIAPTGWVPKGQCTPQFVDKESWVVTQNVKGKLVNIYGAKTVGKHKVRSITFVIKDEDGDELHINGSLIQGTKSVFNWVLNNVWNTVSIWIYEKADKREGKTNDYYPDGSVRDENGEFVENTFFEFNKIDLDGLWSEIEKSYWYWLKEWTTDRVFVEPTNPKVKKDEGISEEDLESINF